MGPFEEAGRALVRQASAGLYQAATDIMFVSQQLCPVDTGTLRASARVMEPEEVGGGRVVCTLGYGYGEQINPKTGERAIQYAIPVHERTYVRHEPPTQSKFLEAPALAYEPAFEATMAIWMTRATRVPEGLAFFSEIVRGPSAAASGLGSVVLP